MKLYKKGGGNHAWEGSLIELIIITELTRRGYPIYQPVIQNGQVDCVLESNNRLFRVQIKTARRMNKKYQNYFAQIISRNSKINYAEYHIDFIICYGEGKFFIVPQEAFSGKKNISMSINKYEDAWDLLPPPAE